MVGLLWAAAVILGVAGVSKLARPGPTIQAIRVADVPGEFFFASKFVVRLLGLIEIGIAVAVWGSGGSVPAALLSASYLALTLVAWRMIRVAPGQDCGCFGSSSEPISRWHLIVNGAFFAVGAAAVRWPQPSVIDELSAQGAQSLLLIGMAVLLAWLCYFLMSALPAMLKLRAKVAAPR
jgi:hypothetical protein